MKKIIGIFWIIFFAICLVGCNNNEKKDNENNQKEKKYLIGEWIADGTQYVLVTGENLNEDETRKLKPYYLTLKDDYTYKLILMDSENNGTYELSENKVYFESDDLSWTCDLKNEKELHCDLVASLFMKMDAH